MVGTVPSGRSKRVCGFESGTEMQLNSGQFH
jgi:hypothetical protein